MLPHPDEHAEITTTCNDENAQYAEVQKKQQTENVYVIICFSLILQISLISGSCSGRGFSVLSTNY